LISADLKIRDIEEGIEPVKTEVLENPEDILKRTIEICNQSSFLCICTNIGGMRLGYNDLIEFYREILKRPKNGKREGIKWITSINNKEDIGIVKLLLHEGIIVRHVFDMPVVSFILSNRYFASTIEQLGVTKDLASVLISNDPLYLDYYHKVFDKLWDNGIDAESQIEDIEKGSHVIMKIIPSPQESLTLTNELFSHSKNEILIILHSINGVMRTERAGGFRFLDELGSNSVKVKVLTALDFTNRDKIDGLKLNYPSIEFRSLQFSLPIFNRVTIVDRAKAMIWEIKDDNKDNFIEALGMAIYIESEQTALSYVSIFNNLWKQSEIYDELHDAYEHLTLHDKMQKEFIELVAHELRTPITPIIGLSERLRDKLKDSEQVKLVDVVINYSKKLQNLTEKILDVTRIEGKLFKLQKEKFSLNQLMLDVVKDFEDNFKGNDKSDQIKFEYDNRLKKENYWITADKTKIGQVISNLIENSIKSILNEGMEKAKKGIVSITIDKKEIVSDINSYDTKVPFVVVSIKDNGNGIDSEILPKLFTKFASRSLYGTGLGLYLSRNIIEAHGGKIWGKNNLNGVGATFSFSLPLYNYSAK
jgi:signal transduction histidine kinase